MASALSVGLSTLYSLVSFFIEKKDERPSLSCNRRVANWTSGMREAVRLTTHIGSGYQNVEKKTTGNIAPIWLTWIPARENVSGIYSPKKGHWGRRCRIRGTETRVCLLLCAVSNPNRYWQIVLAFLLQNTPNPCTRSHGTATITEQTMDCISQRDKESSRRVLR